MVDIDSQIYPTEAARDYFKQFDHNHPTCNRCGIYPIHLQYINHCLDTESYRETMSSELCLLCLWHRLLGTKGERKPAGYFSIRDYFSKHSKESSELMKDYYSAKLIGKIFRQRMLDHGFSPEEVEIQIQEVCPGG